VDRKNLKLNFKMGGMVGCGVSSSLVIHILDQALDVFAATLFFFEEKYWAAGLTFGLVLFPGFCVGTSELRHFCSRGPKSLLKAIAYCLLTPLWAVIVHMYSCCDDRYLETALFFKTMEGFMEAGPQLALQLSMLVQGATSQSKRILWERHIGSYGTVMEDGTPVNVTFQTPAESDYTVDISNFTLAEDAMEPGCLQIFGRIYNEEDRYWFGWIHVLSVFMSFVSIFTTTLMYNEARPRTGGELISDVDQVYRCDTRTCGKMTFGVPFFLSTLVFRTIALMVLITFLQMWTGVILFMLFFFNVLTSLSVGDDFSRAVTYGLWSLLVPAGYNTDPAAFIGYTKLPLFPDIPDSGPEDSCMPANNEPPSEKDLARSHVRTKYFLTMHVLTSIFILGPCVVVTYAMIFASPEYYLPMSIMSSQTLSNLVLPTMLISLGLAVLTVRPYHRIDCSGGEVPKGNIIV